MHSSYTHFLPRVRLRNIALFIFFLTLWYIGDAVCFYTEQAYTMLYAACKRLVRICQARRYCVWHLRRMFPSDNP